MAAKAKPCTVEGCPRTKKPGHPRWCYWHWLPKQPAAVQTAEAGRRLREAKRSTGFLERGRVPADEWPADHRWCAGCQGFVPLFYVSGSRCKGCASRDSHASHLRRTYGMPYEEYEALLAFQQGRCYICGQVPRSQRLAVDHDHETGENRGLLCANDEWGCNVSLRRFLADLPAALRLVDYITKSPLERMRDGDPRPVYTGQNVYAPQREQIRASVLGTPRTEGPARSPESNAAAITPPSWRDDPAWSF
jgi:hypothetical protein